MIPLEEQTRTHITTDEAAFYMNRKPQTMRVWSCYKNAALKPKRINGRLMWSVEDIKRLLKGEE